MVAQHLVGHRDVDETAEPRALCAHQCGQHAGERRLGAAEQVADLEVGHGDVAGIARDLFQQAGHRDVVDVVAGALRPDAALAIAADRTDDEPRVAGVQRLPAEAEALHHTGAKALDQHVGLACHREQCVAVGRVAQVQPQHFLAGVEAAKHLARPTGRHVVGGSAHVARAVLLALLGRAFDLDDLGAHLGQMLRRQWAGQQAGEVDDANALQWKARVARAAHSKRPSRSHFVATHFSPSNTGAPPCSERVIGCGRS